MSEGGGQLMGKNANRMGCILHRDAGKVVCRTCQREIGPGCRCRHVNHPRGLIALDQKYPENVDSQDIEAAGWLLQISEWVMCCQQRQEQ